MKIVLSVNKPVSLTPNQVIEKVRIQFPHFAKEKIGFAGRLDPMARGVLLLMVGDANYEREQYLSLDKTYQFTALLGIETDSYDLLGVLDSLEVKKFPANTDELVEQFIEESIGQKDQPYPPYSTKPVQGKRLFKWAKEGKLDEIEIPTKVITIYSFKKIEDSILSITEFEKIINEKVAKIEGEFRQEEILEKWHKLFEKHDNIQFKTITFEVKCSSGTYVRSLVHNLGKKLGCSAVTIDINRTKVGTYKLEGSLELKV